MPAPTFLELARSIDRGLAGNINFPFRVLSALAEAITENDFYLAIDATANNVVATLPSAVTAKKGLPYWIIRTDSALTNAVTLATTGGQTINGAASASIGTQYGVLQVVSNGTNWLLFASPTSFALASDVLWTFPGQLSTDQDSFLYDLKFERATAFVAFDAKVRVAPVGASILVDWTVNGVIDVNLQVEIVAGATFGEALVPASFAIDDVLRPVISQVGAQTPGQTMVMRARGT